MRRMRIFVLPILGGSFLTFGALLAHAQITNQIRADIRHPFIIGNTTLPPGHYIFRMVPDTDLSAMTVTSANGDTAEEFLVRMSRDPNMPRHTELIFNRYGNKEFLEKIYQSGSQIGVAVMEPSRIESRLQKQGQTPVEHTEEGSE